MTIWRYYSNTAVADTLAVTGGGNLSTTATSIYAGSGAPSGYPTSFPFILALEPGTSNMELVLVNSGSGTSAAPWIITRAADGTTAKTHNATTPIAHTYSAVDMSTAATHYNQGSGSGVHGLPSTAWLTSSFATIQESSPAAGVTSLSFPSISQSYKNLMLVGQGRLAETTVVSDDVTLTFNGDAGAFYGYGTWLVDNPGGTNANGMANAYAAAGLPVFRLLASNAGTAAMGGGGMVIIPNYTGTALNKQVYSLSGGADGSQSFFDVRLRVGAYTPASQAAITSLSLVFPGSGGLAAGSFWGLYGFG